MKNSLQKKQWLIRVFILLAIVSAVAGPIMLAYLSPQDVFDAQFPGNGSGSSSPCSSSSSSSSSSLLPMPWDETGQSSSFSIPPMPWDASSSSSSSVDPCQNSSFSIPPMPWDASSSSISSSKSSSAASSSSPSSSSSSSQSVNQDNGSGGGGNHQSPVDSVIHIKSTTKPTLDPYPPTYAAAPVSSAPAIEQNPYTVPVVTTAPTTTDEPTLHSGAPEIAHSGPGTVLALVLMLIAAIVVVIRVPQNNHYTE